MAEQQTVHGATRRCGQRYGSRLSLALAAALANLSCAGNSDRANDGALAAPSNLTADLAEVGVDLSWQSKSRDATWVEIERKTGGAFFKMATLAAGATSYLDDTVLGGKTYSYRVRATTDELASSYSNEVTIDVPDEAINMGTGGMTGSGGMTGGTSGSAGNRGTGGASGGAGTSGSGAGGSNVGTGGSGTGGSTMGGNGGTGGGTPAVVSFKKDVVPILVKGCGSTDGACHFAGQADGRSKSPYFCQVAWLSTVDEPLGALFSGGPNAGKPTGCPDLTLYERLTQIRSMLCSGAANRQRYVVPRDLNRSLLYQVIAGDPSMGGTCTISPGMPVRRMPLDDDVVKFPPLTPAEIKSIGDWILSGAPNN